MEKKTASFLFLLLASALALPQLVAQSCSGSAQLTVTIAPLAADVSNLQTCTGAPWKLSAVSNLSGGSISYAWSNGQTGQTIFVKPSQATTYVVTVADTSGCSATDSILVPAIVPTPTLLADSSGTFSDGSGTGNYFDLTDCHWLIEPPGATSITLDFTAFGTEAGYDFVKVFDGNSTASPLLGSFSGSNLPPQLTSSGGSMLVQFESDFSITEPGWEAHYAAQFCIANLTVSGNPITPGHYVAGNSITSPGRVAAYTIVIFEAGQEVSLEAGFTVELGADFHAFTGGDCSGGSMKPAEKPFGER